MRPVAAAAEPTLRPLRTEHESPSQDNHDDEISVASASEPTIAAGGSGVYQLTPATFVDRYCNDFLLMNRSVVLYSDHASTYEPACTIHSGGAGLRWVGVRGVLTFVQSVSLGAAADDGASAVVLKAGATVASVPLAETLAADVGMFSVTVFLKASA